MHGQGKHGRPDPGVSVDNHLMAQLENFRLKVFRAVAEQLNFRKAAEQLFLTQPAVTLQIKALENDLGVRLFDRSAGRITLTRQGSVLLGYANKVAKLVADAERELGGSQGEVSGELLLGVSTTIAQYVLPRLLQAFLEEHPRVQFSLHSGNTSQVVELLLEGKVAIGLIEGPSRERGVHVEPFMEDELVLITPPHFQDDHLPRAQFVESTLLMREQGSGSRRVVERFQPGETPRCRCGWIPDPEARRDRVPRLVFPGNALAAQPEVGNPVWCGRRCRLSGSAHCDP